MSEVDVDISLSIVMCRTRRRFCMVPIPPWEPAKHGLAYAHDCPIIITKKKYSAALM